MALLGNKYGESAVNATRNNALPPYLDTLFEENGVGGAQVEILTADLLVGEWNENKQQEVTLNTQINTTSQILCFCDSGLTEPAIDLGVRLESVVITGTQTEETETESATAEFTFSIEGTPTEDIEVFLVTITSKQTIKAYYEEISGTVLAAYNGTIEKASEAATSATNAANSAAAASQTKTEVQGLKTDVQELISTYLNAMYPIGSIYMNVNSTNPSTLFGGTWEQIEDTFLLSAGSTYTAGSTGGEATHTLTVSEMPAHKHDHEGHTFSWGGGISSTVYCKINAAAGTTSSNYIYTKQDTEGWADSYNTGGGSAHNNMPPYLVVYVWQRVA